MRPPLLPLAFTAAALGFLASGCASGGTAPIEGANGSVRTTVRVDGPSRTAAEVQLTHDDRAIEADLNVPADRVYGALPSVYESLGLQVNTAVSNTMTIGVNGVRMRRVGKMAMSRFVTCGTDITGIALADSYAVTLTVMSRVTPQGTGASLLSTQVLATAQPMSVSGTSITCQSTGSLEEMIRKATLQRAGSTGA